jgi:hypothetical protein
VRAPQASAESIPLADDSADAVMALLTVHHWTDVEAGIGEPLRIARQRVVIFTWDQIIFRTFWLVEEYLPEAAAFDERAVAIDRLIALLGGARIEAVSVPHDCTNGFGAAFWRRPKAYLDPEVRAGISMLAQTGEEALRPGLTGSRVTVGMSGTDGAAGTRLLPGRGHGTERTGVEVVASVVMP